MANNNNQNKEGKITAGELFDKLKSKKSSADEESEFDELRFVEETEEEKASANGFSIDISAEEESDSELDINDLLKKYMPEYGEESDNDSAEGGVLSKLKRSADDFAEELPYGVDDGFGEDGDEDDNRLISALDSAFGPEDGGEDQGFDFAEDLDDDLYEDAAPAEDSSDRRGRGGAKKKEKKEKKPFSLFGFGRKKKAAFADEEESFGAETAFPDDDIDPFASHADDFDEPAEAFKEPAEVLGESAVEEIPFPEFAEEGDEKEEFSMAEEPAAEEKFDDAVLAEAKELEKLAMSVEDVSFRTTDLRFGDIAELESALNDTQPVNRITPETRKNVQSDAPILETDAPILEKLEAFEREEAENPREPLSDAVFAEPEEAFVREQEEFFEEPVYEEAVDRSEESLEEEVDPTDLNLRVAFGLDEEEQHEAHAAAKQLGDQLEAKQYKREKRVKLDRQEFVDKTQIPKIRKEYKHRVLSVGIRLVLCAVFTALLMWFENITFFTDLFTGAPQQFAGVFDPAVYPVVYIMASLQLMLLACLCAYEQVIDGFKYLFRGIPKAESLLAVLMVAGVVYSGVLARLIETPTEPVMFNFVVAIAALLTLVYALYNTRREKMNFDIVSSKKTKHIIRRLPDEESKGEAKAFMEQTDVCDVMKIEKTDFIDGFFGRIYQPDSTVTVFMTCMMSIAVAIAVLVGFFVNMSGGSGVDVLKAAYMTLLVTAPVSVFVSFSYPFYRATLAANEYDSAIIGETSLGEYSNASIISFDDKNVFPSYSVKIQNIKIYNNARVDRVLYYAASVFAHAGGPLQDVFEVATLEMGHSEDVQIFDTEAGFLATQVNGVNIIFGSYGKLTEKGFYIPEENASDDVDFSSELSIMYMFREDKLVAKIYVKYVMDGDIDLILKQFQGTGLYVCVRTFDPNIDERMIAKKLNMKRIPLKVVRYASTEEVTKYEAKVDSGLVTSASPKSLLQVISYCDKVLHTRRANIALCILSLIIGVAIIGFMLLSNSVGIINSLFIAIYHLLWIVPMVLSAKVFIR